MTRFLATLALLSVASCLCCPDRSSSEVSSLDVYEAVFRHQFESNASGAQRDADAYFLTIEGKDPSKPFLERFQGHEPPVRPGSLFRIGLGLHFRVDRIQWLDPDRAEVEGGYYEAELSSSGNTYLVVYEDGRWVVKQDSMRWIS